MNGKKAKKLRKLAEAYVLKQEGKPLSTGYNEYRYIDNKIDLQAKLDDDGNPMLDPEGVPLMAAVKTRGTIFSAYLVRMVNQRLKKVTKQERGGCK